METKVKLAERIGQSVTIKAFVVLFLTLLLLIPGAMIQELISERKFRSIETIEKINAKWSNDQTINGPVLTIPYEYSYIDEK
ncbi:MAG TPA: inner membrane CreD family protein, partial [Paludibacter sp.]|nr:inner membrane CreD family protein [Paludibacter sp.]